MKLKIVHQNQGTRPGDDQETAQEELEVKEMEDAQMRAVSEDDPGKDSDSPLEAITISATESLLVSGKRKRKPKEVIDEFPPVFRRKKKKPSSKQRGTHDTGGSWTSIGDTPTGGSSVSAQFKSPTVTRAEEVQSSLGNGLLTFLKPLVRSHVSSCFWMGLPVPFCRVHLPNKDTTVILENENNEEFPIKYIAHKTGLSAGWRRFVAGNKLLEGDVLIFQLTKPCRFKVYIIRANDLNEVDGALSLLNLDSRIKQSEAEASHEAVAEKRKHKKPVTFTNGSKDHKENSPVPVPVLLDEHPGNDSDEVASKVLESTKVSGNLKSFKDFHVMVNGECIDPDLPDQIREHYYELCCSRNALLHDRLLPGLYGKLASSMIVETVNIADSIRGCALTTPRKDFEVWEKSLRSFELLGLNVSFLRARLHQLVELVFESEEASDARHYSEAQNKWSQIEDEIRNLEEKLAALRESSLKCKRDIKISKMKAERFKLKFEEAVNSPW